MDPPIQYPPPPSNLPQPSYEFNSEMQIPMQTQALLIQPGIPVQQVPIAGTQKLGTGGKLYLQTSKSVVIKEKPQYIELMGFNKENIYTVFAERSLPGGLVKGQKMFKVKESSSCFCRNCCPPSSRPFSIKIWAYVQDSRGNTLKQRFLKLTRPGRCTCLCLNRPYMTIYYYKTYPNYLIHYYIFN